MEARKMQIVVMVVACLVVLGCAGTLWAGTFESCTYSRSSAGPTYSGGSGYSGGSTMSAGGSSFNSVGGGYSGGGYSGYKAIGGSYKSVQSSYTSPYKSQTYPGGNSGYCKPNFTGLGTGTMSAMPSGYNTVGSGASYKPVAMPSVAGKVTTGVTNTVYSAQNGNTRNSIEVAAYAWFAKYGRGTPCR